MHEAAYIRPSPSSGTLGGVAAKTREAMLVVEAAGYDIVIVETVGVGQSETAVAGMTDMYCLLQLPNAGDDLQAIKKGVMELADLVVINKADLDAAAATRAQATIASSMRSFGYHGHAGHAHDATLWHPHAIQVSALKGTGIEAFWAEVQTFKNLNTVNRQLERRRQAQAKDWMWDMISTGLRERFANHPMIQALLPAMTEEVLAGSMAASTAARALLNEFTLKDVR